MRLKAGFWFYVEYRSGYLSERLTGILLLKGYSCLQGQGVLKRNEKMYNCRYNSKTLRPEPSSNVKNKTAD